MNSPTATLTLTRDHPVTRFLTWLLKTASILTGLAASPVVEALPPQWMAYALLIFAAASWLKDGSYLLLDLLDNGKPDGSFVTKALPALLMVSSLLLFCSGCTTDPQGNQLFLGLNRDRWTTIGSVVDQEVTGGAITTGVATYAARPNRSKVETTSGK